jgi:2-hydroxychromene-2-carboxylate isomerase
MSLPMADEIEFYFDFISPYGYCAASRIEALAERHGRRARWRAFNMRSVNANHLGMDRPLFQLPLKGPYFSQDVPRTVKWFRLPYNPGSVLAFNPLAALRAFWFLSDQDEALAKAFAWRIMQVFFAEKTVPNEVETVAEIAAQQGADRDAVLAYLASPAAKARLKAETEHAVAQGVWGTPTFQVETQLFWGCDRMAMMDDWLASGGW